MDEGQGWAHDDKNGNFEELRTQTFYREVSYHKVIKGSDGNDFFGAPLIHGLKFPQFQNTVNFGRRATLTDFVEMFSDISNGGFETIAGQTQVV